MCNPEWQEFAYKICTFHIYLSICLAVRLSSCLSVCCTISVPWLQQHQFSCFGSAMVVCRVSAVIVFVNGVMKRNNEWLHIVDFGRRSINWNMDPFFHLVAMVIELLHYYDCSTCVGQKFVNYSFCWSYGVTLTMAFTLTNDKFTVANVLSNVIEIKTY